MCEDGQPWAGCLSQYVRRRGGDTPHDDALCERGGGGEGRGTRGERDEGRGRGCARPMPVPLDNAAADGEAGGAANRTGQMGRG